MHVIFISACEKKALKKTRAVLDSYAIRTGQSTWQAPMTMEGLTEVRKALKQKGITRQTAVAAYINYGMRRMKLAWVVGAKHRFNSEGAYPVASTGKPYTKRQIDDWVRAASLLAGAAGDMHDIGKASQHFQNKLSPNQANKIIADDIRHEWLSVKLLQQLRHNNFDWQDAWQQVAKDKNRNTFTLGDLTKVKKGVSTTIEAVDYLIITHHGLLGVAEGMKNIFKATPNHSKHVRQELPRTEQLTCAGELPQSIFDSYQKRMARLAKLLPTNASLTYYKALCLHARNALIHADHTISAVNYLDMVQPATPTPTQLFANTCFIDGKKQHNQPLEWHLRSVGERASVIACKMMTDLNLSGLCEQTVEYIKTPTQNAYFKWQNVAGNALQKFADKHPDVPTLVFNIAGTGSGKTRMNLRTACTLRPNDPRICIALNLRSLTLQTGDALKKSMNLSDDELAVVIGDNITQELFEKAKNNQGIDEDENPPEPIFDAKGEDYDIPAWLNPLFEKTTKKGVISDNDGKTLLASPLLVSTIDYLIAAGEPHKQGHHVKALLRLMSSDLILDEIDGYDPQALMAVLRLVQLSAMYGRHVICSSATLSKTLAISVHRAFESGIAMRQALLNNDKQAFNIAIVDNEIDSKNPPKIWQQTLTQDNDTQADDKNFKDIYQTHLNELQLALAKKTSFRLAELKPMPKATISDWQQAVLESAQILHDRHAWQWQNGEKCLSFGLIRVANIHHAISLAHYFANHWQHAHIACYHANDWRINRFYKEQRLDTLLSRHKDGKKRKTGNETIEQDSEIIELMNHSQQNDVPFIVIATPVEEVGRDHDFDWAVIDASSVQSIVQTAGRVNRHRRETIHEPNIIIPQFNYRHCKYMQQKKSKEKKIIAFKYPGYEGYNNANVYPTHDLAKLLPWQNNQLIIDARLRFDKDNCLFAQFDDSEIQGFCERYFYDEGDELFSNTAVESSLMTEQLYQKFTPLRDRQYQALYRMNAESITDNELVIEKYVNTFNPSFKKQQQEWQDYSGDFTKPILQPAKPQAWLYLSPSQMVEQCEFYDIDIEQGCQISLSLYNDKNEIQWLYDEGFGVVKK